MAPFILHNSRLIDPLTDYDGPGSIKIADGIIQEVIRSHEHFSTYDGETSIDCNGYCLAPGIVDMHVFIGEPGARHKESFNSGGHAAAAGGITTIVTQPDTLPVIDDPAMVEFIHHRAKEASPVKVLPTAAMTKGLQGQMMTEYQFLKDSGAVALSNAYSQIKNTGIMCKCLEYATSTENLIMYHPHDADLSLNKCATSGVTATRMGLPSVHVLAEAIALERDIRLVEISKARYHADQLSSKKALESICKAKENNLQITASASVMHLFFNEDAILNYKTFSRVTPPLRSEYDRHHVVQAIANGIIDVITSAHRPQDEESKRLPYHQAASGAIGLETLLSASLNLYFNHYVTLPQLFRCLSLNPSKILKQNTGHISPGSPADLVLFDINQKWEVKRHDLLSKSKNSPFHNLTLTGRVLRTFVNGRQVFNSSHSTL